MMKMSDVFCAGRCLGAAAKLTAIAMFAAGAALADAKSSQLACSGYSGTTSLTNFQALVKLTEGAYGFSYSDYAAADGSDLWFTDADGAQIPHEIDTWNTNGTSLVWVRIPEVTPISENITMFRMHWGAERTAEQTAAATANIWKNNSDGKGGFVGVWHMGSATGSEAEPDMTGNGLDAEPCAMSGSGNFSQMVIEEGFKVGAGRKNSQSTSVHNALMVPDYGAVITDESRFTVSGWFRASAAGSNYKRFFSTQGVLSTKAAAANGWEVRQNGDYRSGSINKNKTLALTTYDGTNYSSKDQHDLPSTYLYNTVYITVAFDGTSANIYENGAFVATDTGLAPCKARSSYVDSGEEFGFTLGGNLGKSNTLVGLYDEVRMYDGVESADRVAANYATMNTPDEFLTQVADTTPLTAVWTGAAGDGAGLNSANWQCYNGSGNLLEDAIPQVVTEIKSSTLSGDCDWSGFDFALIIGSESVLDLNGHSLTTGVFQCYGTITNGADETAADLCVSVPSGETLSLDQTMLGGNLRLVKYGAGTLVSAAMQTYTGGTLVAEGVVLEPENTVTYDGTGDFTPYGTGEITIESNTTFTVQSMQVFKNDLVLAGGTLGGNLRNATGMVVRVTADSAVRQISGSLTVGAKERSCDLGGHTLTISAAVGSTYFRFYSSLAGTTGKLLYATESDYVQSLPQDCKGVDLEIYSRMHLDGFVEVHDFTARNANGAYGNGAQDGLNVYGTFTPASTYFYGCVMQDGSTIDISAIDFSVKTNGWSIHSSLKTGSGMSASSTQQKKRSTLFFADNATVYIKPGDRVSDMEEGTKVVDWTGYVPSNLSGLKFKLADGGDKFFLKKKDDGLYVYKNGLTVFIR